MKKDYKMFETIEQKTEIMKKRVDNSQNEK